MLTLPSPEVVQETALRWKREAKIAFVPTMGCLHEGHLSLVRRAKELAPKVIVSIFVNPLQFGQGEDFEKYPRTLDADAEKLEAEGVDMLFVPTKDDLYPPHFSSRLQVTGLTDSLEGVFRPGHFDGVATVCLKLFQITQSDFAIFGEKDFQQLRVIQQLTADMNLPLLIVGHPTVREQDGLAMSSRNRYLSPEERERAGKLPQVLREIRSTFQTHPEFPIGEILKPARKTLEAAGFKLDYLTIASARDMKPVTDTTLANYIHEPRIFVAGRLGSTRLIDNQSLEEVSS